MRCATVAQQVKSVLQELTELSSVKSCREWKVLTLRQWAGVLAVFGHRCDRTTISHWESGDRKIPDPAKAAYAAAIAWRAGIDSDGKLEAHLTPKWRVIIRRICDECGKAFKLERVNSRYCRRCRR